MDRVVAGMVDIECAGFGLIAWSRPAQTETVCRSQPVVSMPSSSVTYAHGKRGQLPGLPMVWPRPAMVERVAAAFAQPASLGEGLQRVEGHARDRGHPSLCQQPDKTHTPLARPSAVQNPNEIKPLEVAEPMAHRLR